MNDTTIFSAEHVERLVEEAWLNLGDTSRISIGNPLDKRTKEDKESPHLHILQLMRQPEYFAWACRVIFNIELLPMQNIFLNELWHKPFPMVLCSRGYGKSFLLALYAMLRALLCQGCKVVVVGAAFRQAKHIFEYCSSIWTNAPVLRNIVGAGTGAKQGPRSSVDRCTMHIGESTITFLPLGTGEKIRGERANYTIADEFAAIPRDIFETVVGGFGVVSSSPIEMVKKRARLDMLKDLGLYKDHDVDENVGRFNQTILSGTASYEFNHFYEYWKKYKKIILSKGDVDKLEDIFPEGMDDNLDWKDFCIMSIPYELIPKGFMDEKQVARSRATVHTGIYNMEYGARFSKDSNGFYKRSLVESCVTNEPIRLSSGSVKFSANIVGNPKCKYVYGIDPASEQDNFSIIITELHPDHRRIVYCWTTTRKSHKLKVKHGAVEENDFYGYCARKIRSLMKIFPCEIIGMDSQGGGIAVMEALHDSDKIKAGELPIWPVIDEDKPKDTDDYPGLHILELVNFASADWTSEANHGMRKDFEDKVLLFPFFDAVVVASAAEKDAITNRLYDTLEDCVMEIEELKDELATIMHTASPSGRDRWDTPEVKLPGGKKGRMRKDRYSSLVICNMIARSLQRAVVPQRHDMAGGVAGRTKEYAGGELYTGPAWFTDGMKDNGQFGTVVNRRGV